MAYRVKEIFYTLQGEGAQAGRPAVFCRFSGCNLWSGRPEDRATAKCRFCDTDFVGADAGVFATAKELAQTIAATFPVLDPQAYGGRKPYIVFTGGEPALQLTRELIDRLHALGFELGVESNGTLPLPEGLDWITVSPKGSNPLATTSGHELKLVWPQQGVRPRISRIWISGISCSSHATTRATRPTPASASPTVSCIPAGASVCRPTSGLV